MMVLPGQINSHVSNAKEKGLGVMLVNLQLYQSECLTLI